MTAVSTRDLPLARARRALATRRWRNNLVFWTMVGPLLIGTILFSFGPLLWGLLVSLFESRLRIDLDRFVGLDNYRYVLTNEAFLKSLWTVVIFAAFIVPTTFSLAMLLAVLVQNAAFGRAFFRSVFFMPTAISYVIASLLWRMSIFSGLPYGVANQVLWLFKAQPIPWIGLAQPPVYWLVLVTVRLWLQLGIHAEYTREQLIAPPPSHACGARGLLAGQLVGGVAPVGEEVLDGREGAAGVGVGGVVAAVGRAPPPLRGAVGAPRHRLDDLHARDAPVGDVVRAAVVAHAERVPHRDMEFAPRTPKRSATRFCILQAMHQLHEAARPGREGGREVAHAARVEAGRGHVDHRDERGPVHAVGAAGVVVLHRAVDREPPVHAPLPVSYTHLTLPTKRIV